MMNVEFRQFSGVMASAEFRSEPCGLAFTGSDSAGRPAAALEVRGEKGRARPTRHPRCLGAGHASRVRRFVASCACALLALTGFAFAFASAAGAAGTIATIAGDPLISGPSTAIGQNPNSIAVASDGALYVADEEQGLVRRIDPATHEESVAAGNGGLPANGAHAFSASSPAVATSIPMQPQALTLDASGDLIVGDGNNSRPGGLGLLAANNCSSACPFGLPSMTKGDIYGIAGSGASDSYPGNGEPANAAEVEPRALSTDSAGDILIASNGCYEGKGGSFFCGGVLSLLAAANCSSSCPFGLPSMTQGDIYTLAGGGEKEVTNGEPARNVALHYPAGVAVDSFGDLVASTEVVNEVFGIGTVKVVAAANCSSGCPYGLPSTTKGAIYTIAGGGSAFPGTNGEPATNIELNPQGVAFDASGDVILADTLNGRTRLVPRANCSFACPFGLASTTAGDIYTIAGGGGSNPGDGGPATSAQLSPLSFATDSAGNLLIAERSGNRARLLAASNCASGCGYGLSTLTKDDIYTIAGNGSSYSGDGGPANRAQLNSPSSIVSEATTNGNIFFDDSGNGRIALISGGPSCTSGPCGFGLPKRLEGDIYTIAGGGTGSVINGAKALATTLFRPEGMALDSNGDIVFSTVTEVVVLARTNCSSDCPFGLPAMTEGDLYIVAGTFSDTASGDEGPATEAGLGNPAGAIAVDAEGDLLIGSPQAQSLRMVAAANCSSDCPFGLAKAIRGDVYRIAGGGTEGSGALATNISLTEPSSITVDSTGDALVGDYVRGVVWLIANSTCSSSCPLGLSSTEKGHAYIVAGGGSSGDGVPATSASVSGPGALTLDQAGDLLIYQGFFPAVRLVANSSCSSSCAFGLPSTTMGDIYRIAGDGTNGYSGDEGPALEAELSPIQFSANGLVVDATGRLLISDTANNRIRAVTAQSAKPVPVNIVPPSISGSAVEGQILTATMGSWDNAPTTFAYQWSRCADTCTPIPGASSASYTASASDVGLQLIVAVTASNSEGASSPAVSSRSATITPATQLGARGPSGSSGGGGDSSSTATVAQTGTTGGGSLPAPVLAQSETIAPAGGTVTIRLAGTSRFVALSSTNSIPNGSEVDATNGHVLITVATRTGTETAEAYGGRFIVKQDRGGSQETHFVLSLTLSGCPRVVLPHAAATVSRSERGPKSRRLWVSEKGGSWATSGRYVSTTVEGTRWLTQDQCNLSKVSVATGKVKVLDLVRNTTKNLTGGQHYTARRR
jgi:hypothetical protein